jgi:hypothetical protein
VRQNTIYDNYDIIITSVSTALARGTKVITSSVEGLNVSKDSSVLELTKYPLMSNFVFVT